MSFIDDLRAILLSLTAKDVDALHRNADTDLSRRALHHTLGSKPSQAAPGNHTHDGNDSPKISWNDIDGQVVTDLGTTNLNTLKKSGGYVQIKTAQATPALNYPSQVAGFLEVVGNGAAAGVGTLQRYTAYNAPDKVWARADYNGWSAWVQVSGS